MDVDRQASFINFVYPFLFEGETLDQRKEAIESAQWEGRKQAMDIWVRSHFPKDDLLAHVERYLNPPDGVSPTALLWQMDSNALRCSSGLGNDEWVLRLKRKQIEVPFRIEAVQLVLYRVGVGFVVFRTRLSSGLLEDWLNFLHYFRFTRRVDTVSVYPQRGEEQPRDYAFAEVLQTVLNTATSTRELWWREVFVPGQLIPFAVLYVDGEENAHPQISELLYRARNFFPSEREIAPASEELQLDHPSLLPYAHRQWFLFSLEGGSFVAVNAPKTSFFRQTLPDHLRDQYFLLFLLTLHQRFALLKLSQMVSEHWFGKDEQRKRRAFEQIRDCLLEFTARGYFSQVMQREHHHRVYQKWQEVFQLERLYQEVSEEIQEMYSHLIAEQTKRLEQRLNLLGALIGIPALVMSFLSINLYGITVKGEGLPVEVASLLIFLSFGVGGLVWRLLSR